MNDHTKQLLQAILDGRQIQIQLDENCFSDIGEAPALESIRQGMLHRLRIKPDDNTITINGVVLPKPLQVMPDHMQGYFFISNIGGILDCLFDVTDAADVTRFNIGNCFATEEDAMKWHKFQTEQRGGVL